MTPTLRTRTICTFVAAIVLVLASAASASAVPRGTDQPSTGVRDGTRLQIEASGFTPNTGIQVIECAGTLARPPHDARSCEGLTLDASGYTDSTGTYRNQAGDPTGATAGFRAAVLPSATFSTVSIHCGPKDPCVLYVGETYLDFTQPHLFLPLAFAGAPGHAGATSWSTWMLGALAVLLVTYAVTGRRWPWARRKTSSPLTPEGTPS